jgi:glycosyltransferase involved in cell wall biosynthesis
LVILSVHNSYQQPGGEDEVFRQEAQLLEQNGNKVIRCQAHNNDLGSQRSLKVVANTLFNRETYNKLRALIRTSRPDVVHVHNTFPLLSPAVYYAASVERVPVVQTLHNYRLLCPSSVLYRENRVCESCMETRSLWPAIQHRCYRQSRTASIAAAGMLTFHRVLETFRKKVTAYIALSEFARTKFIQGGLQPHTVFVKPNFIDPDPGRGSGFGDYCMFVGRLTEEKGVRTLLEAWTRYTPSLHLEIAGDGELASEVQAAAARCSHIRWLGRLDKQALYERMQRAAALIVPSVWYEPFGLVVAEAFAMGVPVIASRIGALAEIIQHGRTGLHFEPANSADLAAQVQHFHTHPRLTYAMRVEARREFERKYTGGRNYSLLMEIYKKTIDYYKSGSSSQHTGVPSENTLALVQIAS